MSWMFAYAGYNTTTFDLNLSNWKVSNVTDMYYIFSNAGYKDLEWSIGDLSR